MTVEQGIEKAHALLLGIRVDSADDPRWQAICEIGEQIEDHPEEIWRFIVRWGGHELEDLRDAIAVILLERLLEYHFALIFPRVQDFSKRYPLFAKMFCRCWKFG